MNQARSTAVTSGRSRRRRSSAAPNRFGPSKWTDHAPTSQRQSRSCIGRGAAPSSFLVEPRQRPARCGGQELGLKLRSEARPRCWMMAPGVRLGLLASTCQVVLQFRARRGHPIVVTTADHCRRSGPLMDLVTLVTACALSVEPKLMHALIWHQSGGEPWAVAVQNEPMSRVYSSMQDAVSEVHSISIASDTV